MKVVLFCGGLGMRMREGAGYATPPLDPDTGGPARSGEILTGVGARNP